MNNYHKWVDENIKIPKSAVELHCAITWMENNAGFLAAIFDQTITHPGLQFSHVIETLTDGIKDNKTHRTIILKWLADDEKVPFGKILKTKAIRKLWKYFKRLDNDEIQVLDALYNKLNKLEYKPSEFKWLDKIHERIATNQALHQSP